MSSVVGPGQRARGWGPICPDDVWRTESWASRWVGQLVPRASSCPCPGRGIDREIDHATETVRWQRCV